MKSSPEDRTVWEVIRDDLLLVILPDVVQVLHRSQINGSHPVYKQDYQQMQRLCGLDFRSGEGPREVLIDKRNEGFVDELRLYLMEWPGRGIIFTSDPILGNAWRDDYAQKRFLRSLERSERGWRHAITIMPSQASLIRKILKTLSKTSATVRGCRRTTVAQLTLHNGKLRGLLEPPDDEGNAD